MEHWLIDACNLLLRRGLGVSENDREWLRSTVESFIAGKQISVKLVYDSRAVAGSVSRKGRGNLVEVFVPCADDYIVDFVRKSRRPRSINVVSDDRADIISAVRRLGCQCVATPDFWELIRPAPPAVAVEPTKPERENEREIDRYLKLFGEG